ncbi:hypothetical protein PMAYCL1PPCAC_03705, partial [Pristionchus mayeri]
KMVSPITVDGSLERRNIFVGEAFGPPNVRVVFAGAAEDTQEREDRVFLLIGPSCATCIDAFCNFFYGVQKDDGYRLHIANEKFDKTTPNKAIVTYVFNDSKMPFRPIVVDVKDDDASLLHKWLTENSRLRIDVVCIVFNLLGRIETKHETAIKEMLSILPKRIRSSASVLLTNSDGHPPPMATLRRFDLQEAPVYKLNWTTLFTGKQDDSLKELLRSNYWNMSEKSLKDMIARIQTLHPQTFNGLPHEPPMFVIHLKPDNASSSSSSSTSTSTFVERRTEHHTTTTHHHYDLPPAMEPVQGRPEPSPPLVKTTIFQTTSKHVEDKTVEGPPAGIPKELLKQIEQRSSDEHSGEKKVVVEKTITVKMVKKDDENDGERDQRSISNANTNSDVIDRARAKSLERQALEQKRREEEEKEMRKIKDQLEKERREREAIERRIREQEQAEIAKRAKQEEERLLLIRVEEERREKHRLEQLAIEERTRREVDERARRLSAEKREMEEERRRLDEERRRLEGRRLEELKKIEEEKLRLDEQRRLLSHEKSQTEAEKRRIEAEMREGERRRKEEEEARRRREEEEERRKREEEDARRKREEEELKINYHSLLISNLITGKMKFYRREVERKAREAEEKLRQETESRREREEEERKRREREEENITITYERTIERTRTEEVDERVLGHRDLSPSAYMTRTYLNGDGPRQTTVIEQGGYRPKESKYIYRFVFDESTRSYIHHLVDPNRGIHRDPSPNRNEQPGSVRILSRTETLIDDPYDDGGFQRTSPERVGHHRLSSPTRDERYQHVRGPSDLRSPGVAATPAEYCSSPEMLRRGETLRRTNQDVQRDSYPSGRESRKRERTQYENLPMDEAGNAYIIPDRMRYSKSPVIMRVKMSPKENSSDRQSAVAPPLPPIQREHAQPLQATPSEYSPPPLYQRTPPANATMPQRATPVAVHFASSIGSGAKPVAASATPGDQYSSIQRPPPIPATRSNMASPIAPVLTPPPHTQSPSHAAPAYVKPPRQLSGDELMSPAGKAPVYGIDRPGHLHPPPPVPIHKHPQQQQQPQRAPLARPEEGQGGIRRPAGMSAEEEREYLIRLRPLEDYSRIPGEVEKGYRMRNRTTYYGDASIPQEKVRFWAKTIVPIVLAFALLAVVVYYLITLAPPFFTNRNEMTPAQTEHMQGLAGAFSP